MNTPIKAMGLGELATLYKVDRDTLSNWLRPFEKLIGKRIGNLYTPKQVRIIFDCLGEP